MNTIITSTLSQPVQVELLNPSGGTRNVTVQPGVNNVNGTWFLGVDSTALSVTYDGDVGTTTVTSAFAGVVSIELVSGEISKTVKVPTGPTSFLGEWTLVQTDPRLQCVITPAPTPAATTIGWDSITDKPATFSPTPSEVESALAAKAQIAALTPLADPATATSTQIATLLNSVIAALKS